MTPSQETQHLTAVGEVESEANTTTELQYWKDLALSAQQAVAVLKEAVEPFARIAGYLTPATYGPAWGFNGGIIEHEDFRRAATALQTLADHSAAPTPDRGGEGGAS